MPRAHGIIASMIEPAEPFLTKAQESLAGAESEFSNSCYNNCANRCDYACFQAAIHALSREGIRPRSKQGQWGHDVVQAEFAGKLVKRRKIYPATLHEILMTAMTLRHKADYGEDLLTWKETFRNLERARTFVGAILRKEGT